MQKESDSLIRGRVLPYRGELDGIRAISLLFVITAHLGNYSFRYGFLGVDAFFVLSGYLITEILLRTQDKKLKIFYRRRFARLAPALFLMVGVVALIAASSWWSMPWWVPILAVTYTMNLTGFFTNSIHTDPLTPTWSLASEEQYYLLWPIILLYLVKKMSQKSIAKILLLLFALVFLLQFILYDNISSDLLRHGPIFRPAGLLLGGAIALYRPQILSKVKPIFLVIISLALIPLALRGSNAMIISISTAIMLIAINNPDHLTKYVNKTLSLRPLIYIGKRSYSLYLWNLPCIFLTTQILGENILGYAFGVILTFLLGFTSFRFVELPFLKRFGNKK